MEGGLRGSKDLSILLVEDDDGDAKAMQRAFNRAKIANPLRRAIDGFAALEILRGENGKDKLAPPFLLLVDLNMPRMNGIQLLQELRDDPKLRRTIAFVLSTSKREEDKMAAYDLNIAGYIHKQTAGDELHNLVDLIDCYWRIVEMPYRLRGNNVCEREMAPFRRVGANSLEDVMADRTINVLIVDDDSGDRRQIRRMLMKSSLHCDLVEAGDMEEALTACDTNLFDVVLMDYHMPGLNGLGAITRMRERRPFLPIIMFHRQGLRADRGGGDQAGRAGLPAQIADQRADHPARGGTVDPELAARGAEGGAGKFRQYPRA